MVQAPLRWVDQHQALRYEPSEIEPRWQRRWVADNIHPHWLAGCEGLPHQGHVRPAVVADVGRRYRAMRGEADLSPIEFPRLGVVRFAGTRMSWHKGNEVSAQTAIDDVGIDALRLAHLQAKHPRHDVDWEAINLDGCARFLGRVWRLARTEPADIAGLRHGPLRPVDTALEGEVHGAIAAVTDAYQHGAYNMAVAHLMALVKSLYPYALADEGPQHDVLAFGIDSLLITLTPATPHITSELWSIRHGDAPIETTGWPLADPARLTSSSTTLVIQVDGRRRARVTVASDITTAEIEALALANEAVRSRLAGRAPARVIVRAPRLVNIVTDSNPARV